MIFASSAKPAHFFNTLFVEIKFRVWYNNPSVKAGANNGIGGVTDLPELFDVVGSDFFKPLTSYYKKIYLQCLNIIYESYRTELSYGIDRELLMQKLIYYFDNLNISEIRFEDEDENVSDSRAKASAFLRKLKEYRWIEYETGNDQRIKVIMPNYAVSVIRTFDNISRNKETEYQSEISAIYSLLTNPELIQDPYPQIVKPVYDRTLELFTALKQLNTSIKKYINDLTADKSAEEIIENYFIYAEEIGSKAYHRLLTSENVSRFRNMILQKLDDIRNDADMFERVVWGCQRVENETDIDRAADLARKEINDIMDYFGSYDDIVKEIQRKHARYLDSTVKRARFLLLNTNNTEGKISTVLRLLAEECNRDEINNLEEDASDELCSLFNIFTQGFVNSESLKTVPISQKITEAEEIFSAAALSDAERKALRMAALEKNKNRFSKKNITDYVMRRLDGRDSFKASEIEITSRRDMIRIIFISLYGQNGTSEYTVSRCEEEINAGGFRCCDFEIRRKQK